MEILNFYCVNLITDSLVTAATVQQTTDVTLQKNISYLEFLSVRNLFLILLSCIFYCVYKLLNAICSITKHQNKDINLVNDIKNAMKTGKTMPSCYVVERIHQKYLDSGVSIISRPISEIESAVENHNVEIAQMETIMTWSFRINFRYCTHFRFIGTISGLSKFFIPFLIHRNLNIQTI